MTSALLELRSLDLHADGIRLQLTRGYNEPPEVRGKDVVIPGAQGRYARSRVADVRSLLLEGNVRAATPEGWRIATDLLLGVLDTTAAPGNLIIRAPYLGLASGTTATIGVRVLNAIGGPIVAQLFQRWSIELESVDPYWVVTT